MAAVTQEVRIVGRYAIYGAIAAGGMATVHLGRLLGPVGFSRTVAIKRLQAQFAEDVEFVSMFVDEARLAGRIQHPNVVPTLDIVSAAGELFLVMEYVPGESLSRLCRARARAGQSIADIPLPIQSAIMTGVLQGLHAAHETRDERGRPLDIVHRDVSPQNVLVGADGVARVLDFGVAKAAGRIQTTKEGQIKGKLAYMPPEQLRGDPVSRRADIYAAGVMFWELLTGRRLHAGATDSALIASVLSGQVEAPSVVVARERTDVSAEMLRGIQALDDVVLRALARYPDERFATTREMALEIERRCPPAAASQVADWLDSAAQAVLASRAAVIAEIESHSAQLPARAWREELATQPPHEDAPTITNASSMSSAWTGTGPAASTRSRSRASARSSRRRRATIVAGVTALGLLLVGSIAMIRRAPAQRSFGAPAVVAEPAAPPTAKGESTPNASPPAASEAARQATGKGARADGRDGAVGDAPTPAPSASAREAPPRPTARQEMRDTMPRPGAAPRPNRAAPAPTGSPASGASSSPRSTPADCSPPYWYDAQGVKHYKDGCVN